MTHSKISPSALVIAAFALFQSLCFAASPADTEAQALIERMVPDHAKYFSVDTTLPKDGDKDTFSVSDAPDGKILIKGNNGVSVASGFNWYLKNRANCHVSWCGDQLNLPDTLPKVGETVTVTCPLKYRVYFNYCTFSYSAPWWKWDRWQREIDFMAMQGINTPLSMVGLEAVWYETLLKLNYTDQEAREFLCGPAFLAWEWMSNIEAHAGPLPKSWIDQSAVLGKKIMERQRALGMTPIQQGFTGHVPRITKEKFPDANVLIKHKWCGFDGAAQLDPLDPFFDKFGSTFLEEQEKLFGTSHLYGCDPFHEGEPPVEGDEYLRQVGKKIKHLIASHDPKGVIVMQSWSIKEAIATSIPKKQLLIVDLGGSKHSRTKNFWGYDFVTGRLHNFGGRINLHGDIKKLATNPFDTLSKEVKNCVGGGLFMEGITQNPAYYEMAFDTLWKSGPVDPKKWLNDYALRRYGAQSDNANKAWEILLNTVYKEGTDGTENSSMIAARPAVIPRKSGPNAGFKVPYDKTELLKAWELLLKDADKFKASDAYRFDVADIGRQVLSNHSQMIQPRVRQAWEARDLAAFDKATTEFRQLLLEVDALLKPRPEYSFAKWVTDARSHGNTKEEKDLYELNARTLLSVWGPIKGTDPGITDYAWREWSGLIKDYYVPRWKMHHDMLRKHIVDKTEYSEEGLTIRQGREAYRANGFFSKLADWELNWIRTQAPVDNASSARDEVEMAQILIKKYSKDIHELAANPIKIAATPRSSVGKWNARDFTDKEYTTKDYDISNLIEGEGGYTVSFSRKGGREKLDITKVEILEGDKVISEDAHQGFAGIEHIANNYGLKLENHAFGVKYTLRVTAKKGGPTSAVGEIFIKKK